jgi:hypothetical protein
MRGEQGGGFADGEPVVELSDTGQVVMLLGGEDAAACADGPARRGNAADGDRVAEVRVSGGGCTASAVRSSVRARAVASASMEATGRRASHPVLQASCTGAEQIVGRWGG